MPPATRWPPSPTGASPSAHCARNTRRQYRLLLDAVILPVLGTMPMQSITLTDIKAWRSALDPHKRNNNAAAYRPLRSSSKPPKRRSSSRVPPKIRGAATARVRRVSPVRPRFDEVAIIADTMPGGFALFVVLASFVGLRRGAARTAPWGHRAQHRSDRGESQDRQGRHRRCPNLCPRCGRGISARRRPAGSAQCTCRHHSSPLWAPPSEPCRRPARVTLFPRRTQRPHDERRSLSHGPIRSLATPPDVRPDDSPRASAPHGPGPSLASMAPPLPNFRPAADTPPRPPWPSTNIPLSIAIGSWPHRIGDTYAGLAAGTG